MQVLFGRAELPPAGSGLDVALNSPFRHMKPWRQSAIVPGYIFPRLFLFPNKLRVCMYHLAGIVWQHRTPTHPYETGPRTGLDLPPATRNLAYPIITFVVALPHSSCSVGVTNGVSVRIKPKSSKGPIPLVLPRLLKRNSSSGIATRPSSELEYSPTVSHSPGTPTDHSLFDTVPQPPQAPWLNSPSNSDSNLHQLSPSSDSQRNSYASSASTVRKSQSRGDIGSNSHEAPLSPLASSYSGPTSPVKLYSDPRYSPPLNPPTKSLPLPPKKAPHPPGSERPRRVVPALTIVPVSAGPNTEDGSYSSSGGEPSPRTMRRFGVVVPEVTLGAEEMLNMQKRADIKEKQIENAQIALQKAKKVLMEKERRLGLTRLARNLSSPNRQSPAPLSFPSSPSNYLPKISSPLKKTVHGDSFPRGQIPQPQNRPRTGSTGDRRPPHQLINPRPHGSPITPNTPKNKYCPFDFKEHKQHGRHSPPTPDQPQTPRLRRTKASPWLNRDGSPRKPPPPPRTTLENKEKYL
ncbi:hypothetical protein T439DRAFT_362979 [Meredithblackwellia eburnea MCA 4105]